MRAVMIDYGVGNLRSVQKAFQRVGLPVEITSDPKQVAQAHVLILPGVGAFARAMDNLRAAGLVEPIREGIRQGKPFLGICLGLQLLFSASEERVGFAGAEGENPQGLHVVEGVVRRFPPVLKVPQMGWNRARVTRPGVPLYEGLPEDPYVYFVHSYYVDPVDKEWVAATTHYGLEFASVIWKDNVFGIQFHPEKSSRVGLQMLANFRRFAEERNG